MKNLGLRIKELVGNRRQSSVAKILDCRKKYVSRLYKGQYFMSFKQIEDLADFIGVDPSAFFE